MKFVVNKDSVAEIVKNHVLRVEDVDHDEICEVKVSEDKDSYIVEVILESEFD